MNSEQVKRQIVMLEAYLSGRIKQLTNIQKQRPAETAACEAAKAELQLIYDNILPEFQKSIK